MFDDYSRRLRGLGRGAGVTLAVVCLLAGAWMVLNPAGARSALQGLGAWREAGGGSALSIATGVANGGHHRLGTALANAMARAGGAEVRVLETAGSVENLRRLGAGEAQFALVMGGVLGNPGAGDAEDVSAPPALPVANVGEQYLHLAVPVDSPVQTLRDLAGKRVGVGAAGGGHEALARRVFGYFGDAALPQFVNDHSPNLDQAFQDGAIDAAFAVYSLFAPAMEELLRTGWYRLVPVTESEALARFLPGTHAEVLPPDLYGPDRSIPPATYGPFPTLRVDTFLVARRDAPAAQVHAVLDALYSPAFRFEARLPELDEARGSVSPWAPLHAEAAAWYARREPLSADRFEVASFFLAGAVTLASALHYLVGRRHWLRARASRQSIRPYFERMLEYGAAVEATSDTTALAAIVHEMMAVQRDAEAEWLRGRLHTEHMENLYLIYNTRTRNAFDKILQLHLQAIIEGGPSPAMYHPEPNVYRPEPVAWRPEPVMVPTAAPEADFTPEHAAEPEQAPAPVPSPPPLTREMPRQDEPRRHKGKKHRHAERRPAPVPEPAPAERPAPAPAPVQSSAPAPPRSISTPVPMTPRGDAPVEARPAPRPLTEAEIEQKYQRSDDYAGDLDSGIVSPPRPRRKPQEGEAQQPGETKPQMRLF